MPVYSFLILVLAEGTQTDSGPTRTWKDPPFGRVIPRDVKTHEDQWDGSYVQSIIILPDPHNEEEKARREGGERIGVWAHHLLRVNINGWLRRSYLDDAGSDPEEGSEGEQGNVLEGEPEFLHRAFVLQQVLRVAHQVLLRAALADHQQRAEDGREIEGSPAEPEVEEEEELEAGLCGVLKRRNSR